MTWLFSRALVEDYENLHCSQELGEGYSEGICSDGKPFAQLNVMPTPHKFWRLDKMIEPSNLSRFGLTLQLFPVSRGAALLKSYLAAFHARTSALQEKATVSMENEADYGQKCGGSFARYSRDSSTWRTVQCSLLGDSDEFSETWPRWGSMRNGVSYLRQMPVLRTFENESGFWPTPVARDYRSPGRSRLERTGGKQGECLPQAVGGRLKPEWVEWMMGWPIGWTELRPLETVRFQEWQQQHGGF